MGWELAVHEDGMQQGWAVRPLADWRRAAGDRTVDRVPVHLRNRIAVTAELLAATFELSAQVQDRMAARGGAEVERHRSQAAWHQALAEFERRQADALRAGRLLPTPRRPGSQGPPARRP